MHHVLNIAALTQARVPSLDPIPRAQQDGHAAREGHEGNEGNASQEGSKAGKQPQSPKGREGNDEG